jgi:hypothetical protein
MQPVKSGSITRVGPLLGFDEFPTTRNNALDESADGAFVCHMHR